MPPDVELESKASSDCYIAPSLRTDNGVLAESESSLDNSTA